MLCTLVFKFGSDDILYHKITISEHHQISACLINEGLFSLNKWKYHNCSHNCRCIVVYRYRSTKIHQFLADRTNGRACATVLRPSVCLSSSSVTLCIVAKRCVLQQKLLLRAYRKSYMRNRLVPK